VFLLLFFSLDGRTCPQYYGDCPGHSGKIFPFGHYFNGLTVGVLDFIGLMILGIPFAPALAAWAALTELIPILGPWLGAVPGVIVCPGFRWLQSHLGGAALSCGSIAGRICWLPRIHGQVFTGPSGDYPGFTGDWQPLRRPLGNHF